MARGLLFIAAATTLLLVDTIMAKPLKVYILAGQSNMVGMASASTLDHIKLDPESFGYFKDIFNADGSPVVPDEVYISYGGTTPSGEPEHGKLGPEWGARGKGARIGPEYAFGIYMHKALDEPILVIKTAWGGKSLNFDFRPPSAGEWTPPPGHPDLVKEVPAPPLPLPTALDIPEDYVPPDDILPRYTTKRLGKFMGLPPMRGVEVGKINGVYPIYLVKGPAQQFPGDPFMEGDLILGVNGQGLREDAVGQWRSAFYGAREGNWIIRVTRWRKGRIESFDFDISQTLPDGRAGIEKYRVEEEQRRVENEKQWKGYYYRAMIDHIKSVLGNIQSVYPDYDSKQGYELKGFVWFQGWNDMVDGYTYPNRNKPGGYDQYSWLLTHFIDDVRKDLGMPELPFVIGVMGVGGVIADPVGNGQYYFRRAMAAPADDPRYKGTVAAVYTEDYWDAQLSALDTRSSKVQEYRDMLQVRDGLKGEALDKAYAEYRALYFTPEEERILRVGRSNQEFHYLGSGKFMVGAGRGFAEAMLRLQQ
ncbi:MAG: hypothetical protein GC164_12740 [Phycisphaera sp.]|nr:hypothetical protein [Phycisphaera sp.]